MNIAPVHKLKTFLYVLRSPVIHLVEMFLLLFYDLFKHRFWSKTGCILTAIIGSITGLSFGAFVSALVKKSENTKIAVMLAVSMIGSFFAGMMAPEMKYIIAQKAPILSYLNPVNLITDAFYCLYYFDTFTRYTINVILLCIFILVFCTGTYFIIRRRKYASL